MDISIIIVNYNTAAIIGKCLDALCRQKRVQAEIFVVDNASRDNSLEVLQNYQDRAHIISNQSNAGFGKANNQVFPQTRGRYVYILNPDAFLSDVEALRKIVDFMDANPHYGLAATRMRNTKGRWEENISRDYPEQNKLRHPLPPLPGEIAWVFGASMIIRREVYAAIHGFDEDYFVYAEDTDIGLRVRKTGHAIGVIENVWVEHIGGASERKAKQYDFRTRRIRSLLTFYQKHYHPQDTEYLVRLAYKKARLRLRLHKFRRAILKTRKVEHRCQKYQAIYDLSREFLDKLKA